MYKNYSIYEAFKAMYSNSSDEIIKDNVSNEDSKRMKMNALIEFRKACYLKGFTVNQVEDGFRKCYEITKEELEEQNKFYPLKLRVYLVNCFKDKYPSPDIEYIKSLVPENIKKINTKVFTYTTEQILEKKIKKDIEITKCNLKKEEHEKQYITKRFIGPTGIVETIITEISEANLDRNQYDYWNNDNSKYDNIDYRQYQDFYDTLFH